MHRCVRTKTLAIALITVLMAGAPALAQGSVDVKELAASHILIMYKGSSRAPETVTRSKEEASELAAKILARAKGGESFEDLANEYSDGPSGPKGGSLGVFPSNAMVPAFSAAVMSIKPGEITGPVETQFGFHIIRRDKVEKIGVRHILVMYEGSMRAPAEITRTQEEAMARATEALAKIEEGAEFAAMAQEYSDGPTKTRGGDLGEFGRGRMVPAFDEAAFSLDVNEVSEIVETPFGYHILMRYK